MRYKIFFLIIAFLISQEKSYAALSSDYVSTSDIVKEIEKTLLFDKESRQKIDIYKPRNNKKSDINIGNYQDSSSKNSKPLFDVEVIDGKIENIDVRQKERYAYNAALVGQYEVAIELYKQILAQEPENAYVKFAMAVVYQKVGQFNQAKSIYYKLLKDDPENRDEVIGNLLTILVEESPKDALYLLSRLTAENPRSPYILAQAAFAYDKAKDYEKAIFILKKVALLDPNKLEYKYNLAVTYDKAGQYEKALELYNDISKNYDDNQSIPFEQIQKRVKFLNNKI